LAADGRLLGGRYAPPQYRRKYNGHEYRDLAESTKDAWALLEYLDDALGRRFEALNTILVRILTAPKLSHTMHLILNITLMECLDDSLGWLHCKCSARDANAEQHMAQKIHVRHHSHTLQ
jgi:hypothetical protein